VAKRLYEVKYELEKFKRELMELKQRVFYNKPPTALNSIPISIPASTDENIQQQLLNQHEKLIQQKKIDIMALLLFRAETKLVEYQTLFNNEWSKMKENHRNLVKDKGMSTTLTNLIDKRLTNITDRWRDIYNYKLNFYLRNSYGDLENKINHGQNKKPIGFVSSSILMDTIQSSLTDKQIQLLNRGPTYVPPCQIHTSSSSIDEIVKKKYAPLKHQIASLFSKHKINIALQMEFHDQIYEEFKNRFSISISSTLRQRAQYEMQLIQTIRSFLKKNNLLLRRTADHMNTFYLGNLQDFEAKADDYLKQMDAYKILITIQDENNDDDETYNPDHGQQQLQNELKDMIESMNMALEVLHKRKAFSDDVYNRLRIDASKVKVPYVYFLPHVSYKVRIFLLFIFILFKIIYLRTIK